MDEAAYYKRQESDRASHEALCRRCGKCCGSETEEPCRNLVKDDSGKYRCATYDNRLGRQLTVSGREFTCVPIYDVIRKGMPHTGCGYTKQICSP